MVAAPETLIPQNVQGLRPMPHQIPAEYNGHIRDEPPIMFKILTHMAKQIPTVANHPKFAEMSSEEGNGFHNLIKEVAEKAQAGNGPAQTFLENVDLIHQSLVTDCRLVVHSLQKFYDDIPVDDRECMFPEIANRVYLSILQVRSISEGRDIHSAACIDEIESEFTKWVTLIDSTINSWICQARLVSIDRSIKVVLAELELLMHNCLNLEMTML